MGISACIISKNEEKNIKRCLDSIVNVVDEIILVDTGSTDKTIEIANIYNCKVIQIPWNNSFSEARNISLDNAKCEWILVIDCDEEVDENSKELLISLSHNKEDIDGFGVLINNIIGGIDSYSSGHVRFFRNKKEYRYEGIIHEQIGTSIKKANPNSNILKSKVTFTHYGYEIDTDLESKKSNRNLNLLNLVKEEDRDGMYYCHLGAEYVRLNKLKKACDIFIKGYKISDKSQPYFSQLAHKTVDSLVKNNEFEKCIIYCEDILKYFEDFRVIYFINAVSYINIKCYPKALENLIKYKSTPENPFKYPKIAYDSDENIDKLILDLQKL